MDILLDYPSFHSAKMIRTSSASRQSPSGFHYKGAKTNGFHLHLPNGSNKPLGSNSFAARPLVQHGSQPCLSPAASPTEQKTPIGSNYRRTCSNSRPLSETEDIAFLEKEVYFALRYLQDVVEKNTIELLAGSTTVMMENIFVFDSHLQNTFQSRKQPTELEAAVKAEEEEMYKYLAILVHWSDEVLLRRSDQPVPMRRHTYVVPAIQALRERVRKLVELYKSGTRKASLENPSQLLRASKLPISLSAESLAIRQNEGPQRPVPNGFHGATQQTPTRICYGDEVDSSTANDGSSSSLRSVPQPSTHYEWKPSPPSSSPSQSHLSLSSFQSRSPSPQILSQVPFRRADSEATGDSGISLISTPSIDSQRQNSTRHLAGNSRHFLHSLSTPIPPTRTSNGDNGRYGGNNGLADSSQSLNKSTSFSAQIQGEDPGHRKFMLHQRSNSQDLTAPLGSLRTVPTERFSTFGHSLSPVLLRQPQQVPQNGTVGTIRENAQLNRLRTFTMPEENGSADQVPPLPPKKQRNVISYVEVFGQNSFSEHLLRHKYLSEKKLEKSDSPMENIYDNRLALKGSARSSLSRPLKEMLPIVPLPSYRNSTGSSLTPESRPTQTLPKPQNGIADVITKPPEIENDKGCTFNSTITDLDCWNKLFFSQNPQGKSELKGGPVDALIIEATKATKNDFAYQEAFLLTYRTFIGSEELINKLLYRYDFFARSHDLYEKSSARSSFSLLLRVVEELCLSEIFPSKLICTLLNFVRQLLSSGELAIARGLRKKILDKHDLLQKSRSTSVLLMSNPPSRKSRRLGYLLDFKSQELAEQMTLMDSELFTRVEITELLSWTKAQSEDAGPHLSCFTEHFNKVSFWARTRILEQVDHRDREKYFAKFIKIMQYLRKLQNFNSYLAILAAVDSAPVRRLEFSKPYADALKELSTLIDSSQSFRAYRSVLAEMKPPCIPYIGIALQDLTFVNENADWLDTDKTVVNFGKRWQQYHILDGLRRFQKLCHYPLQRNDNIVQFFNNFDSFLPEESLWQISEAIKPRGSHKATHR